MTRPKRESTEHRIILDLFFPVGQGVNEGMCTKEHLGEDITYSLPSIADLIHLIKEYGQNAMIWKVDLTRA